MDHPNWAVPRSISAAATLDPSIDPIAVIPAIRPMAKGGTRSLVIADGDARSNVRDVSQRP